MWWKKICKESSEVRFANCAIYEEVRFANCAIYEEADVWTSRCTISLLIYLDIIAFI